MSERVRVSFTSTGVRVIAAFVAWRSSELILTAVTARRSGRRAHDRPRSLRLLGQHTQGDWRLACSVSCSRSSSRLCRSTSVGARGGDRPRPESRASGSESRVVQPARITRIV
jgi:hypothetical protein